MLVVYGYHNVDEGFITIDGILLYVFYSIFFIKEIIMAMLGGQLVSNRDPDIEINK